MMRAAAILIPSLLIFCLESHAIAEKAHPRSAREKAAKKACATGDFAKGVDILADLYVESNDLAYVYNQGRCYQQNNRWEQAISRFREYLRKATDIPESERAETERQIAECEQSMGKNSQVAPPPAEATPPPVPIAEPATRAPDVEVGKVSPKPSPPPLERSNGKGLRVAGIVTAIVGVAAIGTGAGLTLKANSLSTADYSRSREDQRASLKTWAWVSYGVGAAAVATGIVLYIVGWPAEGSSQMALLPVVSSDGASLLLDGRF